MSDAVGNTLGRRGFFIYETDDGQSYSVQQDCSLAQAVGNDPTISNLPRLPASQKTPITPRTVLLESVDNVPNQDYKARKEVIVGDPDNALFQASSATQFQINGVVYTVTARKGERVFYPTIGGCDNGNGNGE